MKVQITLHENPSWRNLWRGRVTTMTKDDITDWAEVEDIASQARQVFDCVFVEEIK